jgi:hypothetical protein
MAEGALSRFQAGTAINVGSLAVGASNTTCRGGPTAKPSKGHARHWCRLLLASFLSSHVCHPRKKSAPALSLGAVAAGAVDKEVRDSNALAASPESRHRRDGPVRRLTARSQGRRNRLGP